ncbi:hypothetical protein QUF86_28450 [Peribacillus sp. NJ11]|uniref:hypothetical protein n=1 Tax=Peribacillus sp. NJ11 TaxID=3055861 RepID=UPI0025A29341|nr:hypothetical protein [Peribacillus sp. NJ11]MDM5224568.1 hypothetical protein [Peribacillus sp. NJ11]
METQENRPFSVPPSIQLLFDNEKLELMKVLCLMFSFSNQSNKRRKVSEILFYYSLVNFDLINLFAEGTEKQNGFAPSPNLYFRFQTKINDILLIMSHLQFVSVRGDISKKLGDITVQLTPKGRQFFSEQNSEFFSTLQENYTSAFNTVSFSMDNLKVIKGVQY